MTRLTEDTIPAMAMSVGTSDSDSISATTSRNSNNNSNSKTRTMNKRTGKRPGRKPAKIDERAKLERSRQSAVECRARKKLRYQYLEELVINREKAVFTLRKELETFKQWCIQLDQGQVPDKIIKMIANEEMAKQRRQTEEMKRAAEVHSQIGQRQGGVGAAQPQAVASTSSAATARIYSSSSSPSSSSSSSAASPPQASSAMPHQPQQQQFQQQQPRQTPIVSRRPPPYPKTSSSLPSRFPLKRQGAFDDNSYTDSHQALSSMSQPPTTQLQQQQQQQQQQQLYNPQSTSMLRNLQNVSQGSGLLQQSPRPSFLAPGSGSALSVPQQTYPKNTFQQQRHSQSMPLPQQQNVYESTELFNQKQQMDNNNITIQQGFQQQQHHQQQQHQQNLLSSYRPVQQTTTTTNQNFPGMSQVKSEPPMTLFQQVSLDDISDLIHQDTKQSQSGGSSVTMPTNHYSRALMTPAFSGSRVRSLSNPVTLMSLNRPEYPTTSSTTTTIAPPTRGQGSQHPFSAAGGQSSSFPLSEDYLSLPTTSTGGNSSVNQIGLFSGIPLACRDNSSAITVEDSDSSEENNTNFGQLLFQSSISGPQKRTLPDPSIHVPFKKAKSLDSEMHHIFADPLLSLFSEGDQTSTASRLDQLPVMKMKCLDSSSGSLNTPSVSPFAVVPRNTDSPMTTSSGVTSPSPSMQSGHAGVTPSSSTNPSPAPAPMSSSSMAAYLDNSGAGASSSALSSVIMDIETTIASATNLESVFLSSFPQDMSSSPVVCNETGLSTTIPEIIPEWYSFLADLQADTDGTTAAPNQSKQANLQTMAPFGRKQSYPHQQQQQGLPQPSQTQLENFLYEPQALGKQHSSNLNLPSIIAEYSSEDSV